MENVKRYKVRFVSSRNEESNDDGALFQVDDFIIVNMILCFALHNKWELAITTLISIPQ